MKTMTAPAQQTDPDDRPDDGEWIAALGGHGAAHIEAVRRLHETVRRAARHQVGRMPRVWAELGGVRAEEIIDAAADEATTAVLANLDRFEGRSRFSTWVYKFGILHANSEAKRALWRDRPVNLDDQPEPVEDDSAGPQAAVEASELAAAVTVAMRTVLTPHQHLVARALIVDGVPIDVVAERLGTNRNAIYKTLHDTRVRLRAHLRQQGVLIGSETN